MNIKTTTLSLVAGLALFTITGNAALGTSGSTATLQQVNGHAPLIGDQTGVQTITASNADQCGRVNTGTFNISTEYLAKYTFNDELNVTHTVGIGNPNTMNQFTVHIKLPNFMGLNTIPANVTAIQGATIQNAAGAVVATFANISNGSYVFSSTASINAGDVLHLDNGGALQLAVTLAKGAYAEGTSVGTTVDSRSIEWDFYTNSGSPILRDHSAWNFDYEVHPQYLVACKGKLDALINWENDSKSFVVGKHGQDLEEAVATTPGTPMDVYSTVLDRLTYTLDNLGGWDDRGHTLCTTTFDTWLEGNETEITVTALDNNFSSVATEFATSSLEALHTTGDTLGVPTFVAFDPTYRIATFTTDDIDMLKGLTTFTAEFDFSDGYTANSQIGVNNFAGNMDLEGAKPLPADQVSPARNTDLAAISANIGEWKKHAYLAQIAGASTLAGVNDTKIFIVNRSCKAAIPQFKLIKDGVVTMVTTGVAEIAIDSQGVYKISKMVSDMNLPDGAYAVEIMLPDVAEDYYIYAQVKNTSGANTQFKDLPVYNTSDRD